MTQNSLFKAGQTLNEGDITSPPTVSPSFRRLSSQNMARGTAVAPCKIQKRPLFATIALNVVNQM